MANSARLSMPSNKPSPKPEPPLAYREGWAYFMDLRLKIEPGVFIPRPETEELVELALGFLPADQKISVLDLGTGSGAIALKIAQERPQAQVLGLDSSTLALKIARANQKFLNLKNVIFQKGDLLAGLRQKCDFLIANLPYLPKDSRHLHPSTWYEPKEALFAPRYGTALIHRVLQELPAWVRKMAFFEIDPCTVMLLKNDLKKLPSLQAEFRKDSAGKTRFLLIRLEH